MEYYNKGKNGTYFHYLIEKECRAENIDDLANYINWVEIEKRLGEFDWYQEYIKHYSTIEGSNYELFLEFKDRALFLESDGINPDYPSFVRWVVNEKRNGNYSYYLEWDKIEWQDKGTFEQYSAWKKINRWNYKEYLDFFKRPTPVIKHMDKQCLGESGSITKTGTIYYLFDYKPKKTIVKNDDPYKERTESLLEFKNCNPKQIDYYSKYVRDILVNSFKEKIYVCSIPSHEIGETSRCIWELLKECNLPDNFIGISDDYSTKDVLIRIRDNGAKHLNSNNRDPIVDYYSIVADGVIPGCDYIVLDDITTSGSSMEAAYTLLKKAGARNIYCFAIAKTLDKSQLFLLEGKRYSPYVYLDAAEYSKWLPKRNIGNKGLFKEWITCFEDKCSYETYCDLNEFGLTASDENLQLFVDFSQYGFGKFKQYLRWNIEKIGSFKHYYQWDLSHITTGYLESYNEWHNDYSNYNFSDYLGWAEHNKYGSLSLYLEWKKANYGPYKCYCDWDETKNGDFEDYMDWYDSKVKVGYVQCFNDWNNSEEDCFFTDYLDWVKHDKRGNLSLFIKWITVDVGTYDEYCDWDETKTGDFKEYLVWHNSGVEIGYVICYNDWKNNNSDYNFINYLEWVKYGKRKTMSIFMEWIKNNRKGTYLDYCEWKDLGSIGRYSYYLIWKKSSMSKKNTYEYSYNYWKRYGHFISFEEFNEIYRDEPCSLLGNQRSQSICR